MKEMFSKCGTVRVDRGLIQVLQDMLDMVRDHENNGHAVRLEWIVIWLIAIEVRFATLFARLDMARLSTS